MNKIVFYRSSITGRRVKKAYADKHPRTTEREVYKVKSKA
jgi:hypothetical protein